MTRAIGGMDFVSVMAGVLVLVVAVATGGTSIYGIAPAEKPEGKMIFCVRKGSLPNS
jgi:hypothetical protein